MTQSAKAQPALHLIFASTCARRRVLYHVHHPSGVAHAAFHLQAGGSGGVPGLLCLVRAAFTSIKLSTLCAPECVSVVRARKAAAR